MFGSPVLGRERIFRRKMKQNSLTFCILLCKMSYAVTEMIHVRRISLTSKKTNWDLPRGGLWKLYEISFVSISTCIYL